MNCNHIRFFQIPTNRGWTRDFGPIVLESSLPSLHRVIARFGFNAWARYSDWKKDNQVSVRLAKRLNYPIIPIVVSGREVVLEGGSVDVNGAGTVLTTEECLLDSCIQVRNPGMKAEDYEIVLGKYLGGNNIIWLNKGIVWVMILMDMLMTFVDLWIPNELCFAWIELVTMKIIDS